MKYIYNLLVKELESIERQIENRRKSLTNLTTQIHDVTVEIYQLETTRDSLVEEIAKREDDDFDLPIRLEGSD